MVLMRRSTTPTRWRALPTLLVVLSAVGLGAATVRAEPESADPRPASSRSADRP